MAWVVPRTWVTGEIVTAAMMNGLRDALVDLDRRTSPVTAYVGTIESTTSTTYTDLATIGPAVTATIGSTGKALISWSASLVSDSTTNGAWMSVAGAGASIFVGDDTWALNFTPPTAGTGAAFGITMLFAGLNPGSLTVTAKYRSHGGGATANFKWRRLLLTPLGS